MMTPKQILASRSKWEKVCNTICLILVIIMAAIVLLPIWWIFRSSLMTNAELYAYPPAFFPSKWLFSNYVETLETYDFWRYFKNTMTIIVPAVLVGTVTATLCGYAFARLRFRGKKFLFTLCVGSMLLPNMVTLIPLYLMWTRIFHLSNSYLPLTCPTSAAAVPSTSSSSGSSSPPSRRNWMRPPPSTVPDRCASWSASSCPPSVRP